MARPKVITLIAIASEILWLMIAGVYLEVRGDGDTVADDRDLKNILDFTPVAGPSQKHSLRIFGRDNGTRCAR